MKKIVCGSMIVSGILALSELGYGQTVKWTKFPPAGSGCNAGDTQIVDFGDTISWVFENLGVNLTGGFAPGSDTKYCAIRAGAEVAQGVYLAELQQILYYGVVKTKGSSGSIATNSTFFGYSVKPLGVSFGDGVAYAADELPLASVERKENFAVIAPPKYWCNPNRNPKGLFTSRIAVNGLVNRPGSTISLAANQYDVKFEIVLGWKPCNV